MSIDVIDSLEADYGKRLDDRAREWEAKHPEDAKVLRAEVWEKTRRAGQSLPEPGTMRWRMLEAAVTEAIRRKKGWPSNRAFLAIQAGKEHP